MLGELGRDDPGLDLLGALDQVGQHLPGRLHVAAARAHLPAASLWPPALILKLHSIASRAQVRTRGENAGDARPPRGQEADIPRRLDGRGNLLLYPRAVDSGKMPAARAHFALRSGMATVPDGITRIGAAPGCISREQA